MTPALYHPRPELWPQFSLRGLLIVVTLVALSMRWGIAEYRAWEERPRVITNIPVASGMDIYVFKYSPTTADDSSAPP